MIAPIFAVCSKDATVKQLLGTSPVRLYPFGQHYDNVVYPYVVWQNVGGEPENYLGNRPDIDRFSIQIDVYANSDSEVLAVASAIRDALEGVAYVVRWGQQTMDSETKKYRYSFDIDWLVHR
ncbi:DUF3168 domain-containing protein [Rosenbergiella collisarenosi]|uniref:DUF3168 domain-containing protein n=1 Tax=Rosenbergiella collisarenosi TaxID=1544695 RepID=UPI001BDA565A|nr:DUF3168 domain-containing protein [Rosenbergiella collisarenosi]MBT0720598.1 DUF3168 domain-containing protein [Rosenbergiella collisarenosi]